MNTHKPYPPTHFEPWPYPPPCFGTTSTLLRPIFSATCTHGVVIPHLVSKGCKLDDERRKGWYKRPTDNSSVGRQRPQRHRPSISPEGASYTGSRPIRQRLNPPYRWAPSIYKRNVDRETESNCRKQGMTHTETTRSVGTHPLDTCTSRLGGHRNCAISPGIHSAHEGRVRWIRGSVKRRRTSLPALSTPLRQFLSFNLQLPSPLPHMTRQNKTGENA